MRIPLIITMLILAGLYALPQQVPLYSQYMMNKFLINPAVAGSETAPCIPIRLLGRQQWLGIEDAPQTFVLSAHTLLKDQKTGVGGFIYTDHIGPVTNTGLQASYSYHIDITTRSILGMGISASAFQFKMDTRDFVVADQYDPVLEGGVESALVPDANFGLYLENDGKYYIGLSAMQLFQINIKLGDMKSKGMVRHYFAYAGYKLRLSEEYAVEPSALIKTTERTQIQADANLKVYYKDFYWGAVSYRHEDAIIAMIGIKYNKYIFGYAYDYTLSKLRQFNSGSHEIVAGYNLFEGKDPGATVPGGY